MIREKENFCNALRDYRYLLDRGYSRESILQLVISRYKLSDVEKSILYRCVHSRVEASKIKNKIVGWREIRGEELVVDGYNVLITLDTSLSGEEVYVGDDGIVRDVRKSYRKYTFQLEETSRVLKVLAEHLESLKPRKVIVIYDSQVSWSGKLKVLTREVLSEKVECEILVVRNADKTLIGFGEEGIIATSDIIVLREVKRVFDLPAHIIGVVKPETINSTVIRCLRE